MEMDSPLGFKVDKILPTHLLFLHSPKDVSHSIKIQVQTETK